MVITKLRLKTPDRGWLPFLAREKPKIFQQWNWIKKFRLPNFFFLFLVLRQSKINKFSEGAAPFHRQWETEAFALPLEILSFFAATRIIKKSKKNKSKTFPLHFYFSNGSFSKSNRKFEIAKNGQKFTPKQSRKFWSHKQKLPLLLLFGHKWYFWMIF